MRRYKIGDIVDTLWDFCLSKKLDPKRTYIWICCLCINQHRVVEKPKAEAGVAEKPKVDFFALFGERVKRIGKLLAMMSPWKSPLYLTRIWCIFEVYTAYEHGCGLDIIMPKEQRNLLEQDLIAETGEEGDINVLYKALGSTSVENAQASVEQDRVQILQMIESTVGHTPLNHRVNELLRAWAENVVLEQVEKHKGKPEKASVDYCHEIGWLLFRNGEYDSALDLFEDTLATRTALFGEASEEASLSFNGIGRVMGRKGKFEEALKNYQKCRDIRGSGRDDHLTLHQATTCGNIGDVLHAKCEFEGALMEYQTSLTIRQSVLGQEQ